MLTVRTLIQAQLFKEFQLISGQGGLDNTVSGTGIFEWESKEDVQATFEPGEFVVTTLSTVKNDPKTAEKGIRNLIDKHVSAIAIKTIFFKEISDDLKEYSNKKNIPIFFFQDTYFDDIIFIIKNELVTQNIVKQMSDKIEAMLEVEDEPEEVVSLAMDINRFYHENIICGYVKPKDVYDLNKINDELVASLNKYGNKVHDCVHSIIPFRDGLLVVYTIDKIDDDSVSSFKEKIQSIPDIEHNCYVGYSHLMTGLTNFSDAIKEAFYANVSAFIDEEQFKRFDEIGLDQVVIAIRNVKWVKRYYDNISTKLLSYDEEHGGDLFETLLTYVKSEGDITLTSQKLYQHSNTTRYRISRIKTILNMENDMDFYPQAYFFIRLHQVYKHLV